MHLHALDWLVIGGHAARYLSAPSYWSRNRNPAKTTFWQTANCAGIALALHSLPPTFRRNTLSAWRARALPPPSWGTSAPPTIPSPHFSRATFTSAGILTLPRNAKSLAGVARNFQVFEPLDFLAEITQHIPNQGEHLIRYYGCHSNKARGWHARQNQAGQTASEPSPLNSDLPPPPTILPAAAGPCQSNASTTPIRGSARSAAAP